MYEVIVFPFSWWGVSSAVVLFVAGIYRLPKRRARKAAVSAIMLVQSALIMGVAIHLLLVGEERPNSVHLYIPILTSIISISLISLLPKMWIRGRLEIAALIFAFAGLFACTYAAIWLFTNNIYLGKARAIVWLTPWIFGIWLIAEALIIAFAAWPGRHRPKHARRWLARS